MTKLDRLNSFLSERLSAALNEIIYTVSMTMKEYEEETARIRKENDYLKEMLKVTGGSAPEENPGVVISAVVSPMTHGQQDFNPSLEQESETRESQNEHRGLKEENCSIIKTEQPCPYPSEADSEPETRDTSATQTDYTIDHLQSNPHSNTQAVEQEIIDNEFPAKIKTELVNTDSHSDSATTNIADTARRAWSPHNWDIIPEINDQNRLQQAAAFQQLCSSIDGPPSALPGQQNRPVEFRAAFSYTNRVICNNTLHCTSRHCEMQKRTIAKSSPVWKYFSLKEGDCSKAVCLMCQAVISRGVKEYTTSALLKHLRMKHGKC